MQDAYNKNACMKMSKKRHEAMHHNKQDRERGIRRYQIEENDYPHATGKFHRTKRNTLRRRCCFVKYFQIRSHL